jgi:hypothetical protein
MKLCPYCAEEIQDAAVRCKHCRSDLAVVSGPAPQRGARAARWTLAATVALFALTLLAPAVARPVLKQWRASACHPTNWIEWHAAMRKQCLQASYVCEHMTTPKLLEDPDVAQAFQTEASHLADMVGRMRHNYGCSPESGRAFHPEPGPMVAPAFPPSQDAPRSL